MTIPGGVMFSVAEDSFGAANRELRAAFPPGLEVRRLGPDLGLLTGAGPAVSAGAGPAVGDVAAACADRSLLFVRHLTVLRASVPRPEADDLDTVVEAACSVVADAGIEPDLAVQAWVSGGTELGYGSGDLYHRLADTLTARGVAVARAGRPNVLSCCITADTVRIGLNRSADSLSDWPGGRVRLARDPARISRAEFKLEELLQTFPIDLPDHGRVVDLGASPGGWTRVLRERGLAVWAVDPADLDPRIGSDPGVRHARTTAAEFLRGTDLVFDVVVNDMRMDPVLSCRVMLDVAEHLRPGALAVMTLKTGSRQPVDTARRCLDLLSRAYTVEHARQLHHNRHEVTVVAHRKGAGYRTADRPGLGRGTVTRPAAVPVRGWTGAGSRRNRPGRTG